MGMIYRCDVLAELKAKGYNAGVLRREKMLSESTIQNLRNGKAISFSSLYKICFMLNCQANDMANAGMDLKSLQYLMGHSDAAITMNVYTHASYAKAEESMQRILQFKPQKTG